MTIKHMVAKNEFALAVSYAPVYATPGATDSFSYDELCGALERHINLDWSDMDGDDRALNLRCAMEGGGRVLGAFKVKGNEPDLWIITEADRSSTTILLPSEY
jgi:hypothetical protein